MFPGHLRRVHPCHFREQAGMISSILMRASDHIRRMGILILLAVVCAALSNVLSPRRIAWVGNWGHHIEAEAARLKIQMVSTETARQIVEAGTHIVLDARPAGRAGDPSPEASAASDPSRSGSPRRRRRWRLAPVSPGSSRGRRGTPRRTPRRRRMGGQASSASRSAGRSIRP